MKKDSIKMIIIGSILVLFVALFVYFYISLNRLENKILDTQELIVDNSNKVQAVVNFLNSSQAGDLTNR